MVFALAFALLLAAPDGAPTPAEGYRLLQKAVEAKDAAALSAIIHPDERAWMRRDVARDGIDAVVARIPRGPLTVTYETSTVYAAKVPSGDAVVFTRVGTRWYAGGLFDEKPVPNGPPITATKAHELLGAKVHARHPDARLYQFDTTTRFGIDPDGASLGWVANFVTDAGEEILCSYEKGEITGPSRWGAHKGPGLADPDAIGFDLRPLRDETTRRAKGIVDPIDRITASLVRSARDGRALWMLDVYGADQRIGLVVVFDAHTMKFSHQTQ
jgi:hypothetical protein